jgi:hypothetical protein
MRQTNQYTSTSLIMIFLFLVSSCATSTPGTSIPHGAKSLRRIEHIKILVKTEEDFSIRISREHEIPGGALTIGLLGKAIESSIRTNIDNNFTKEMQPKLGEFNLKRVVYEKVASKLEEHHVFSSIEATEKPNDNPKRHNNDGLFEITIKQWGLIVCTESHDKVRPSFHIDAKIVSFETEENIFEHNRLYAHGKCYLQQDLLHREGLLATILVDAIDYMSTRIVDEIRFP